MNQINGYHIYLFTLDGKTYSPHLEEIFTECQKKGINIDLWPLTNNQEDLESVTKTLQFNTIVFYINSQYLRCVPDLEKIIPKFIETNKYLFKNDKYTIGYNWALKEYISPTNQNTRGLLSEINNGGFYICDTPKEQKIRDNNLDKAIQFAFNLNDKKNYTFTIIMAILFMFILTILLVEIIYGKRRVSIPKAK
jgi:hypothetical protein